MHGLDFVQDLYTVGARKFLVFEIDAMGCEPAFYEKQKNECSDKLTSYISTYNHKLEVELQILAKTVRGAIFALAKRYQLMYDLVANPTRYGESYSFLSLSKKKNPTFIRIEIKNLYIKYSLNWAYHEVIIVHYDGYVEIQINDKEFRLYIW